MSSNLAEVAEERGATLLYEIDPELNPKLPQQAVRQDAMYSVSKDMTMLQLNLEVASPINPNNRETTIPRLLWVRKDITMKELHFKIFKQMRYCFSEWAHLSHPDTNVKSDLRRLKFPYRKNPDDPQMTREAFDALSDEEAFAICCQDIVEGKVNNARVSDTFDINRAAYQLEFKDVSRGSMRSGPTLVPFVDDVTMDDKLNALNLTRNDTLFETMSFSRGKEVVCSMVWHKDVPLTLFNFLASAYDATPLPNAPDSHQAANSSREIQLS